MMVEMRWILWILDTISRTASAEIFRWCRCHCFCPLPVAAHFSHCRRFCDFNFIRIFLLCILQIYYTAIHIQTHQISHTIDYFQNLYHQHNGRQFCACAMLKCCTLSIPTTDARCEYTLQIRAHTHTHKLDNRTVYINWQPLSHV